MEVTKDYDKTIQDINKLGIDKFFNKYKKKYEKFKLYDMSKAWINDKKYILKFKGTKGDLVVYWK